MLQKEIKDWAFEVRLLTGEPSQFLIPADWVIENDLCQILWVVLDFFIKLKGLGLFFCSQKSCPKLSKNVTCSKTVSINKKGQFLLAQSQKNDYQLWTAQSHQNDQFENLYISSHGEARNTKFGQQVNLIQRVLLGTPTQRGTDVITSYSCDFEKYLYL